jgi:hypothetical protein
MRAGGTRVLAACLLVLLPVGLHAATTSAATIMPVRTPWQSYVVAPHSRTVRPVRIVQVEGDVIDAAALLSGTGTTILRRPPPHPKPAWPEGTHVVPTEGQDATAAACVIDGRIDATWRAQSTAPGQPLRLQLQWPSPTNLGGITLRAAPGHVIGRFDIDVWRHGHWHRVARVSGNRYLQRAVTFHDAQRTERVRLSVPAVDHDTRASLDLAEIWPAAVHDNPPPSVTLDFGRDVVGHARLFVEGASADHPGLRLAFSETRQYLGERSDFTRSDNGDSIVPGTDQVAVFDHPFVWIDRHGCRHGTQVCADGLHGFRYLRISLDALPSDAPFTQPYGQVRIQSATLDFTPYLGTADTYAGWFECSDPRLDHYWFGASYTNELITGTFVPDNIDPRQADSSFLRGKQVLLDGAKRDRDPYAGDVAVSALTTYLTHGPELGNAARNVLLDLARHQSADGWIPPASIRHYTLPLFEYPLWWIVTSWDNMLYTGDLSFGRRIYPRLQRLLDDWYPEVTDAHGLLDKCMHATGGYGDYAFLPRTGEVTYYNALYVLALHDAVAMAQALDRPDDARRWSSRADTVAAAINRRLWDARAGAYLDSRSGPVRHAQDGNALAVITGIAGPRRARQALDYLSRHTWLPYGNAFMDNDMLVPDGRQRVYAFTSYPEIAARFQSGLTASAFDEIQRLYGWMAGHDPGTTDWEGIGKDGSQYEAGYTSDAHGWSTGVVPLLTNDVLGVTPTAPGFSHWRLHPHPGSLHWARGRVPTPHGPLDVDWTDASGNMTLDVSVPRGTQGEITVPVPANARVTLDGAAVTLHRNKASCCEIVRNVMPGHHEIRVIGK